MVPLEPAISNLYATAHHYDRPNNMSPSGDNYSVVVDFVPGGDTAFEGAAAKTTSIHRVVAKNGQPFSDTTDTEYFNISPYKFLGRSFQSNPTLYYVASAQGALPPTGKPGDTGQLYDATIYSNASKTGGPIGTSTQTWAVTADTATTDVFCVNSVTTLGGIAKTASDCYVIDVQGSVPSIRFTVPN